MSKKTVLLAVLVVLTAGMPVAASGSDRAAPQRLRSDGAVGTTIDPNNRVEWTPERLAGALPLDYEPAATETVPSSTRRISALDGLSVATPAVLVPGTESHVSTSLDRFLAAAGGPVGYKRFAVPDPSAADVAMHGKLYMLIDNQPTEGVCSATVVPSATGMVVFTAAHCLMSPETGQWILDGGFVPGYKGDGQNPYAFWPLENLWVTQQWYETSDPGGPPPDARYDVAAFTVQQYPYIATNLQDTVGARGIGFNLQQGWAYQSFGYPAAGKFDGEKMISCISNPAIVDPGYDGPPFPNGMGCDMTGGSSGGGWVIEDQYLNSVVSYAKTNGTYPQMQFGPYFGQTALELFEGVSGLDYPDVEEPGIQQFGSSVSLRLVKHLKAKGKVSSAANACKAGSPVVIVKLKKGKKVAVVAQTISKANGSYSVKLKDKPGKYAAVAAKRYGDSFTLCEASQTKLIKHGH